ncbi:hypothetical protein A4H97_22055 [Niastella yeongjuensis]|uniref:Outer membrane protein beta-barrel domain-containing protein n=1 Tax=Niastella yeongjuensis TaxID=354355 RepID=A0A1V9F8A4_9BACT|nr:outer membrane beta-barrel protein [Niastella yeongjuensis]OQP54650.1 hypothetical protein A4H97_22055 [Niastella yeongjuensis]SEO02320.1 Outer membrane protein beta-barrel domain-containing protein [Niastella yeongjuensis]
MSDHEFEKQVHQKLQELKLRPSDGVWMEVQRNIHQGKSRRRIMWWWMAAVFVGITAGGFILYTYTAQTHTHTTDVAKTAVTSLSTTKPTETSTNSTSDKHTTTLQPVTEKNTTGEENASPNASSQSSAQQPTNVSNESSAEATGTKQPVIAATTIINKSKKQVQQPNTYNPGNKNRGEQTFTNKLTYEKQRHRTNKNKNGVLGTIVIMEAPEQAVSSTIGDIEVPKPENLNSTMPARVNDRDNTIATNKATATPFSNKLLLLPDSLGNTTAVAQPIQHRKPSLWHWGAMADAGYSRIAESRLFQLKGLLGTEKYYAEDLAARSNASPSGNNSTNNFSGTANNQMVNWSAYTAPPKKASPIQADFSFSVGLFVQRTISPRLKISLGLEYNYISVHTEVGQKVNSAANPIVVNVGPSQATVVKTYYKSAGTDTAQTISGNASYANATYSQRYTYRFHYLEMPLTVSWQINKGRRLPPFQLEGGFSIARLISEDALHYEGIKGVYYKDNDLFNKTQINFVAGLSVGLLQRSKHPIWIGPNLRYALNGLVNKDVSTGQYAWSTGISIKVLLGKL